MISNIDNGIGIDKFLSISIPNVPFNPFIYRVYFKAVIEYHRGQHDMQYFLIQPIKNNDLGIIFQATMETPTMVKMENLD